MGDCHAKSEYETAWLELCKNVNCVGGDMRVYVVVGTYRGCIDHVQTWADREEANKDHEELKIRYGIKAGHEEESENATGVYEFELSSSD